MKIWSQLHKKYFVIICKRSSIYIMAKVHSYFRRGVIFCALPNQTWMSVGSNMAHLKPSKPLIHGSAGLILVGWGGRGNDFMVILSSNSAMVLLIKKQGMQNQRNGILENNITLPKTLALWCNKGLSFWVSFSLFFIVPEY